MKTFITIVLCSLVVLAFSQSAKAETKEENYIEGKGNKQIGEHVCGEILLREDKVEKEFDPFDIYAQYNFQENNSRITYIELIHNSVTEKGSASYYIYGGVGTDYVKIDFVSEPLQDILYTVKIYGVRI